MTVQAELEAAFQKEYAGRIIVNDKRRVEILWLVK
jgi:hypothetical protein